MLEGDEFQDEAARFAGVDHSGIGLNGAGRGGRERFRAARGCLGRSGCLEPLPRWFMRILKIQNRIFGFV